jgi:hypothetical protein
MGEPIRRRGATVDLPIRLSRGRQAIARYVLFETPDGEPESVLRIVTEIPPITPEPPNPTG